jgi:hypothetical protein
MRIMMLALVLVISAGIARAQPGPADSFDALNTLAGEWQAELPGFGTMTNTIRMVSNGRAIEETIGTAADNEVSIYARDNNRILLTHFCAMTPDGHVARLQTAPLHDRQNILTFLFRDATNLHSTAAPHMRRVVLTMVDPGHFTERWTRTEKGVDTVFDMNFVRHPL